MTHCGHKSNEPSHCTQLPLILNDQIQPVNQKSGQFSGAWSTQNHDQALINGAVNSNRIHASDIQILEDGDYINDCSSVNSKVYEKGYPVQPSITESAEALRKSVKHERKRDREPSRIPVKRLLKVLRKKV